MFYSGGILCCRTREDYEKQKRNFAVAINTCEARYHQLIEFATTALENKCPLKDVQKTLGHVDSRTTKIYDKHGDNPERSATFFANYG